MGGNLGRLMNTVLFDLDGTLCDLTHRLHHIKNGADNWDAFFDACHLDTPILPVIALAKLIWGAGYRLVIVSGRSDVVRGKTEFWLRDHGVRYNSLIMRKDGDFRADDVVKSEILDTLLAGGAEILFAVDDRQRVVDMWRKRGVTCLQAAAWEE